MQHSLKNFLIASLVLILAISPMMFQQNVAAQDAPSVFVSPAENIYHTDTTPVGAEFDVTIEAADWVDPGVYSFELKLYFDSSMLEPVVENIGIDPDFWITAFIAAGGLDTGDVPFVDPDTGETFLWFSATLLGAGGNIGGGILAKAGFKIIDTPGTGKTLTSDLDLRDVIMVNPATTPPSAYPADDFTVLDGIFQFIAPQPPTPLLKASSHTWDMDEAEAAGRLFDITVSIEGLEEDWHLVGIQFWLEFDTTLLSTKEEWITEGDFLTQFGGTFSVNYTEGDSVIYGLLQLPPWQEPWPSGSGTVAVIQFEAIFLPPPAADCDLTLFNVVLVDPDGIEIPYSLEHGRYAITVAPPPWLSVAPKTVELENVGDTFALNVAVNELDAGFRLVGAEFKVRYNTSILMTKEEWITEGLGNIMREVADRIGEGLFFQAYVQEDHGLIGIIILPLPDGTWPYYPEGTGVLAAIEFEALVQLDTEDILTFVSLDEVLLVDSDAKEVPLDEEKTTAEGTCEVTIKQAYIPPEIPPAEKSVDLFTQYTAPFGGQGYRVPSDAFGPQGQIMLYSKVLYRGDGVPYKPVVYRIRGPGGFEALGTEFSDSEGLALMTVNVPASEEYFGLWEVTASVDIAGEVVTDYLPFRVGWLVEVKDFEVVKDVLSEPIQETPGGLPILVKGRQYELGLIMSIITMQNPVKCVQLAGDRTPLLITAYSGFDELLQPFFYAYEDITSDIPTIEVIEEYNVTAWSFVVRGSDFEPRPYGPLEATVEIPTSAFSGEATIYANFLTDYPAVNGVPYSDPRKGALKVFIRAEPPAPIPGKASMLSVTPETILHGPDTFAVTVDIHEVDSALHIVAIQFALEFDKNLLSVQDVVEGPFVQAFGETFFTWIVEEDVLVGVLQLPPWPGPQGWMEGGGALATILFETSYKAPPSVGSALTLVDAFMVNADGEQIDFLLLTHGYVEMLP